MGSLNVNELDFALIKENIKTFLSSQSEFTDYDFDGAGMNILMDLLAYATNYMGIYGNMTFNEMFITTGLLRSSVVSKALELGYVPSQNTSSVATLTISTPSAVDVTCPKGTIFRGVNADGKGFAFVTLADYIMVSDTTTATAQITVYEGTIVTDSWTYTEGSGDRYILSNENTDVKHMHVNIRENASTSTIVEWLSFNNIVNIGADTEAYFYRETIEGKLEVYFGNGVIGKSLINDNIIEVESLVSNGGESNGIKVFTLSKGFSGLSVQDVTIVTNVGSAEGTDKESIDRIKHNAPLYYQTQNRTTTENDYTSILLKEFDYIQAINVWGGEENDPPYYGRVLISIKPDGGSELTEQAQADILEYLEGVKVTGIVPQLVTPEYSYIDVRAFVKYNAHLTTKTSTDISAIVDQTIDNHFTENLYAFNATLKYSELITDIDASDASIFSNYVEFELRSDLIISDAFKAAPFTYTVSFNNPVKPSTITMDWTNSAGNVMKIADDGEGVMYLYQDGVVQTGTSGTVDYDNGKLVLVDFNPYLATAGTLSMYADPDTYDIETIQNNILLKGAVTTSVERVLI